MGDPAKASGGVDDGKQGVSAGADGQGAAPRRASPIDGNVAPAEAPGSWPRSVGESVGLCPRCKRGDELAVSVGNRAPGDRIQGCEFHPKYWSGNRRGGNARGAGISTWGPRSAASIRAVAPVPTSKRFARARMCSRGISRRRKSSAGPSRMSSGFFDHPGGVRPECVVRRCREAGFRCGGTYRCGSGSVRRSGSAPSRRTRLSPGCFSFPNWEKRAMNAQQIRELQLPGEDDDAILSVIFALKNF